MTSNLHTTRIGMLMSGMCERIVLLCFKPGEQKDTIGKFFSQ